MMKLLMLILLLSIASMAVSQTDISIGTMFQPENVTMSSFSVQNETTTIINCSDRSNQLNPECINRTLGGQSSLIQIILVALVTGVWILYLTFFNSRFVGLIITKVANRFLKEVHFHIGSFSISVLSGKIMFRNVKYITKNYSVRVNDGYIIFRWWRPYKFTDWPKQHELNHGHTRLSVVLFGLECHIYNNSEAYKLIEEIYEPSESRNLKKDPSSSKKLDKADSNQIASWRKLFPVIKFLIYHGKVVAGNRLLPNTLVAAFAEGDLQYKTTEPSNPYDLFLHAIEGVLKTATVSFIPSLNFDPSLTPTMLNVSADYKGPPPRKMGDGYKLIDSNTVTVKYYWDEPGTVPLLSQSSTFNENDAFANRGDEKLLKKEPPDKLQAHATDNGPLYEVIVYFGKHTTLNYGPWADRQRELVYNFFYPYDYQDLKVTKAPKPGDKRTYRCMKISAMFINGADLDVLYSKVGGIGALQINTSEGSLIEMNIPQVVEEDGYTTHISGQLLHPDVSTSLHYRSFLTAEMFVFDLKMHYPRQWNALQTWDLDINLPKAALSLVFQHKDFFADVSYDWSYKSPLDFLFFIPYNINFNINLDEYELCLPLNKYNWVDCNSKPKENAYLALYGSSFSLSFVMPNEVFLPNVCSIPFNFQTKEAQLYAFLPESNMSRNNLHSLASNQKNWSQPLETDCKVEWDRVATKSWGLIQSDWVVVGEIPSLSLILTYSWHPLITPYEPPTKTKFHALPLVQLSRVSDDRRHSSSKSKAKASVTFDPNSLDPDVMKLELTIPTGAVLILYGSLVDLVVAFKDNYLGYDDTFTDFASRQQKDIELKKSSSHGNVDNYLYFRPLEVTVNVIIQDISAILPIHYTSLYVSQPRVRLKQLLFEMGKNYQQTRLQLLLDDLEISVKETTSSAPSVVKMNNEGRLRLNDLQLRGHAMFSSAGLPMGSISVEYAWLMEVLIGDIKGLLSFLQLQAVLDWLDNFAFLSANDASQLERAFPYRRLPTGLTWNYKKLDGGAVEETDVKYLMTRIRLQSVHLRLAQDQTIVDLHVSPITVANGNVQDEGVEEAWSVAVKEIQLKHYVLQRNSEEWLETGEVRMGPIIAQVSVATKESNMSAMQEEFLKFHDRKTRRLHFVWDKKVTDGRFSVRSPLWDSVKGLKSWGCSFFAPIVEGQPTMYYDVTDSRLGRFVSVLVTEEEGLQLDDENEDVFDPKMDFGMSILKDGKVLIRRPEKIHHEEEQDGESEEALEQEGVKDSTPEIAHLVASSSTPAGEVLMQGLMKSRSTLTADIFLPVPHHAHTPSSDSDESKKSPTPVDPASSLKPGLSTETSPNAERHKSSAPNLQVQKSGEALISSKSSSVDSDQTLSTKGSISSQKSKTSTTSSSDSVKQNSPQLTKSSVSKQSSNVDKDRSLPGSPEKLKRKAASLEEISKINVGLKSDDTNLFLSAESQLLSSGSSSSESFYSAESDVEIFSPKPIKTVASFPELDGGATKLPEQEEALPRPGNLEFNRPRLSVVRKLDLSSESIAKSTTSLDIPRKKPSLREPESSGAEISSETSSCYKYLLATARFKNSDWLPEFEVIEDGVHPSIVIEKENQKHTNKRTTGDIFSKSAGESCTSIILHIKGGVDIQTSPFLLDSLQHIMDAISTAADAKHPSSILSHLQAKCTSDAMADFHLKKLNNQDALGGVFANALGQADGSKTILKIYMDLVRVNVVQATPGDEPVFNLRLNKMLPTPCLTIATIRLDRMDVSAQLNSKKDKLLSKARRTKADLSQSCDSDREEEIPSGHSPIILLKARGAVHSLACQLRVLSQNGCAPERSNVSSLAEENCRSPFKFDSKTMLPRVKETLDCYDDFHKCPPKPWGWVMFEAGINSITADIIKHERPMPTVGSTRKHESEGQLHVELIWLNAVAPQSASQASKSNRAFRSWNLLTALAPSCCAWLAPADHLMCATQRLTLALQNRYFTTISAALTLASQLQENNNDKKALRISNPSKYDMLTELSKAIKNDPSCILCDAFQRHFLKKEDYLELESAILEERNIPALVTLETSIQIMLGLLLDTPAKPNKRKSTKRQVVAPPESSPTAQLSRSPTAIKYDGALEMSTFLKEKSPPADKFRSVNPTPATPRNNDRFATSTLQNAENVVQAQQRSMYSWMQNQGQQDIEAQTYRNPNRSSTAQALQSDSLIREANTTYYNFLSNAGITNLSRGKSNAVQSVFGGGLFVKGAIGAIKMEKQNPDRVYTKDSRRRNKVSFKRRASPLIETPIIGCQSLSLNISLVDSPIRESFMQTENNNASNNNKVMDQTAMKKFLSERSKVSADISCSIGLVKQRIDIALVRLVHQFVLCGTTIQQGMTDIQVNKYTAGAFSPDVITGHRRGFSNISTTMFGSNIFADSFHLQTSKRRFTLPATPFHGSDSDTSSEESFTPSPCWQKVYKLADLYKPENVDSQTAPDFLNIETELSSRGGMGDFVSFTSLEVSASLRLEKVQFLAEVGDLWMSIILNSLKGSATHVRTSTSPFKFEAESNLEASLKAINAEVTDKMMKSRRSFLTSHVGLCEFNATANPNREVASKNNTCSLNIGKISIDLPQRPSSIHDVVTRSTRRINDHFQELVAGTPSLKPPSDVVDGLPRSTSPSATTFAHLTPGTPAMFHTPNPNLLPAPSSIETASIVPMTMSFEVKLEGIELGANMLPSSIVRYTTESITGVGIIGKDSSFIIELPGHAVHFSSSVTPGTDDDPTTTSIPLPRISAEGEVKQNPVFQNAEDHELPVKEGDYLSMSVSIGNFEHTLTTDLFNQLKFVQDVLLQEVDHILMKMSADRGATAAISEASIKSAASSRAGSQAGSKLLYQLQLRLDGIEVTAVTSSQNAVRLKTGTMTFELSNRVVGAGQKLQHLPKYLKIFGKAQVDISLGLGTLIDNPLYPEAEAEFQQLAYFTTRVGLQNTTQTQERAPNASHGLNVGKPRSEDNSVILINLTRPIFFIQPTAFDKAILFFLVYKNAYEEWTEKRDVLESSTSAKATASQVFSAFQSRPTMAATESAPANTSSLFLQLCVNDLGICIPVARTDNRHVPLAANDELSSALVLTIDNTLISACYARSLVSGGQFRGFCLRFADDFQTSWDDWAPKTYTANSFVVPDGTYQICTDTTSYQGVQMRARTTVNIVWKMKGMDVKLDTKIGYYLTTLLETMTLITGHQGRRTSDSDKYEDSTTLDELDEGPNDTVDGPITKLQPNPSDPLVKERLLKERSKKLEHDYNEQVRLISDLRSLGAKQSTVEEQERRLHGMEVELGSVFRKTFRNRLRRSSLRVASAVEPRKPSHQRSISTGISRNFSPVKPIKSAFATLPSFKYGSPSYTSPARGRYPPGFQRSTLRERSSSEDTSDEEDYDTFNDMMDDDVVDHAHSDVYPDEQAVFSPNVVQSELADLELILDIRVGIDGGKIVCQPTKNEDSQFDLSASNGSSGFGSAKFSTMKTLEKSSNETVFYVPGVTVKCRYNSAAEDSKGQEVPVPGMRNSTSTRIPVVEIETPGGTKFRKRSSVYLWFSLQSLPEMIISPCFLDFLEQTLQATPVASTPEPPSHSEEGIGAVESLDTFAALPMDTLVFLSIQPSQVLFNCQPMSRVECLLHIPSLDATFSNIRHANETPQTAFAFPEENTKSDGTKLSSRKDSSKRASTSSDASLKAFPSGLAITVVMSDFSIYVFHPYGTQVSSMVEPKPGSGRKDSLSVNLEVVRVNIVRTTKGSAKMDASFKVKDKSSVVNMSALLDIGTASFKYDMRRLSEILAFPRAWYRRSIARRLFLGDTTEEKASDSHLFIPDSPLSEKRSETDQKTAPSSSKDEWVSIVLYCLKMSHLDVQMNMSNVMGNTLLSCDGLTSQGKLALQSSGDQDLFLSCNLQNSQLSARGGIIGGHIELRKLYANCRLLEPSAAQPRHKLCIMMRSLDGRIEYMGGCIMMGKLTDGNLKLSDEWKRPKLSNPTNLEEISIFVPGDFEWNNFSLAISRSTTPDVIKMLAKLEEFFTMQFNNSVRALSSLRTMKREVSLSRQPSVTGAPQAVYAFHRHWPSVYTVIKSLGISPNFLLGGSLRLHGKHLTIVCFHGNNFRSRAWLLFNILEPNITFSTEVQEIKESMSGDEASTLSIESLTFNLGHDYWLKTSTSSSDPMATVSRVTRSRHENPPPSSATIDEWFAYITASHTQELSMLRTLNDIRENEVGGKWSPAGGASRNKSTSSYSHDTDIIFALPKLQLDFRTEHEQGAKEPDPKNSDKPIVDCSFVTEFTDHICVTMDVELMMSLHDIISNYLKEKQQALSNRGSRTSVEPTSVDPIDLRQFICNTWQLEPTVRLISWAGRRIEPVGVDYILQQLGFRHARTTIPKWFQRGVLDVLDQTLAVIVQNLIVAMHQRKKI